MDNASAGITIATLGPRGTFSHEAALIYNQESSIVFKRTIFDCFEAVVNGSVDLTVVPIENSVSGGLGETYDCLLRFESCIIGELLIAISHNLVAQKEIPLDAVTKVFAHPQTYAQCENTIRSKLNGPEIINTSSNAASAHQVKKAGASTAAIVSALAVRLYDLYVLETDIQDNEFNTTRFVAVAGSAAMAGLHDDCHQRGDYHQRGDCHQRGDYHQSGDCHQGDNDHCSDNDHNNVEDHYNDNESFRTSIIVVPPPEDKPGILNSLTASLAAWDINMSKIVSRPAKGKLGDYVFYVDFHGHRDHAKVQKALKDIEKCFGLKVLGSYRRVF